MKFKKLYDMSKFESWNRFFLINNSIFKWYSENKYQINLSIIFLFFDYFLIVFACECMVENMSSVLSK